MSSNQLKVSTRFGAVNPKKYKTVASSAKIHTCIFEKITKKKEKDNIECASVQTGLKKIAGGRQNSDRSCIERRDARYHYVAEAHSLICDPENGEVWIRLND